MITTSGGAYVAILNRFHHGITSEAALAKLGVDVPEDVTAARAVVDAIAKAEHSTADVVADLAEAVAAGAVKPADVEKRATAAATARATSEPRTGVVNRLAPLAEARIAALLASHADAILEDLRPRFNEAAEHVTRAVELGIGPATTPAEAMRAGSDVAESYAALTRVAGQLDDALLAVQIARGASTALPVATVLDADAMPEPREDGADPLWDADLLWQSPTAVPGGSPGMLDEIEDGYVPGGPAVPRPWPAVAAPGARYLALVGAGYALRLNLPGECPARTVDDVEFVKPAKADPAEVDAARELLEARRASRAA